MSDWLNNFGYSKTLTLFNEATSMQCKESVDVLEERRQIMQLINEGRVSEAIRRTNILAPQVLQENKQLALQLKIQEFVELFSLMKSGDQEAYAEALEAYTQNESIAPQEGMLPPVADNSASTSTHDTPTQRNKRAAPESSASGEAKRRTNQSTVLNLFICNLSVFSTTRRPIHYKSASFCPQCPESSSAIDCRRISKWPSI